MSTVPLRLPEPQAWGLSWPLLVGVAALLIPTLLGVRVLSDPDTYWHIAAGRWMVKHGSIPTHDPFSFSMPGVFWLAHEWGAELLIFSMYRLAGWQSLVLLVAVCFSLTLSYLTRFLLARMRAPHALLLTGVAGFHLLPNLLARPHVLVWPLTAVWVGTLVQSSEGRRVPPWWLLVVLLLWANLHASFIIGLGFAAALAVESVLTAGEARLHITKGWALFILASVACVLLNPQGYHAILFPFDLMRMETVLATINEWRPPNFPGPQLLDLWLLLTAGLAFSGRVRLSWIRLALVIGLTDMAQQHQRNIALLGLIAPLLLALAAGMRWRATPRSGNDAVALDRWLRALAAPARRLSLCLSIAIAAFVAVTSVRILNPQPAALVTPRVALDALLATGTQGPILNGYGFGGYLIFRGIPVFIDGRADMYGDAFVRENFQALWLAAEDGPDLVNLLGRYHVNATLLSPNTPALKLLDRLPQWRRVYSDKIAVVHVRRVSLPAR